MRIGNSGFSLLSVIAATVIGSIFMLSMMQMIRSLRSAERGVASNVDLTEVANFIHLITGTVPACAKSGLLGVDVSPLLLASSSPLPVALHYPAATGPGPILVAAALPLPNHTRNTKSLALVDLASIGTNHYLVTLRLETDVRGIATTHRSPKQDFYLRVKTDAANVITECSSSSAPAPVSQWVDVVAVGPPVFGGMGIYQSFIWTGGKSPEQICSEAGFTNFTGACKGIYPVAPKLEGQGSLAANQGYGADKWGLACLLGGGNGIWVPPTKILCN